MKKVLLASVLAIASFPGYALAADKVCKNLKGEEYACVCPSCIWQHAINAKGEEYAQCADGNVFPLPALEAREPVPLPYARTPTVPAKTTRENLKPRAEMSSDEHDCAELHITDTHPTSEELATYDTCVKNFGENRKAAAAAAKPARFQPQQQVWQCNDIRLTITIREQGVWEYDLGGTALLRMVHHRSVRRIAKRFLHS